VPGCAADARSRRRSRSCSYGRPSRAATSSLAETAAVPACDDDGRPGSRAPPPLELALRRARAPPSRARVAAPFTSRLRGRGREVLHPVFDEERHPSRHARSAPRRDCQSSMKPLAARARDRSSTISTPDAAAAASSRASAGSPRRSGRSSLLGIDESIGRGRLRAASAAEQASVISPLP